jgi:hypothetical protein
VWDDLLLVLGVPLIDPFGTDEMDSIREGDALTKIPASRLAELAGAPFDKLREAFHEVGARRETN